MSRLARQTIELALAHLPETLVSNSQCTALRALAPALAPGRQLYFEVRLAGADDAIDVSQHFFVERGGVAALRRHAGGQPSAAWSRIARFAACWPEWPAITELGFEHDAGVAAPAVFAAFRGNVLDDRAAAEAFVRSVAPAAEAAWRRLVAALETAEACGLVPGRMIGVMLSRDGQLRCMIRGLSIAGLRDFLGRSNWTGDTEAMFGLLEAPTLLCEGTRLVLGFAPEMTPDWGIEVIHRPIAEDDSARSTLLEWLVGAGLADPARVDAVRAWRGAITPVNARADWPDAMIVDDLRWGRRSHFESFLNHVKINVAGGQPRPAKAYLALAPVHADA
jgi:hypothetical protein